MRSRLTSAIAVLGVVALLLVGGNTAADAASGAKSFFLGKSNHTKKQTTITRTKPGTVLSLNAKPGSAPLAVNSGVKVGNLNADTVDGFDSSQMVNPTNQVFSKNITTGVSSFTSELAVAPGTYHFDYSAFLPGATGWVYCEINATTPNTYVGISQFNVGTLAPGLSASGVVTKAVGGHVYLICGTQTGTFTTQPGIPVQVVMTATGPTTGSALRVQQGGRETAGQ